MTKDFDNILDDTFDIRDVIERFEELESLKDDHELEPDGGHFSDDESTELKAIESFLDDVKGYGGDEQWRGDWYPVTFIRDSYFITYAEELADDIGAVDNDAKWPLNHIDWESAANALKDDYSEVDIQGETYWYR